MARTTLEIATLDFFDFFFKLKSEDENIYWSGHDSKPNIEGLKEWFLKQLINENRIIFQISNESKTVGYLYFDIYNDKKQIELSYAVSNNHKGKGIGTSAIKLAVEYSKKEYSNFEIIAFVAEDNIGSNRIMFKNNFQTTGNTKTVYLKTPKKQVTMLEYKHSKKSIFIIAEAGVNHNGDINLAKKLIDAAKDAGVDAVKFQTWKTELLVTKDAKQAEYQTENTKKEESQFDMLKRLELSYSDFDELKTYCDSKQILFLSTPDEVESANFLNSIQDIFKIGSGELTNKPFLQHIGRFKKDVIISTGMGNLNEIEEAVNTLIEAGTQREQITVLHANTQYPTPMQDVHLHAMKTIGDKLNVKIGYSDHTLGIEVPIAAVALGAEVIEKHFTLDNEMNGPDHKASLEPKELAEMVKAIRNIEQALGGIEKKPSPSEVDNMVIVRKSIVANKTIQKGDVFTDENIIAMRPGTGISPMKWDDIVGSAATKDYVKGDLI